MKKNTVNNANANNAANANAPKVKPSYNPTAAAKSFREDFGLYFDVTANNAVADAVFDAKCKDAVKRFGYNVPMDSEAYDAKAAAEAVAKVAACVEAAKAERDEARRVFGFSTADEDFFKEYKAATTRAAFKAAVVNRLKAYATKDFVVDRNNPVVVAVALFFEYSYEATFDNVKTVLRKYANAKADGFKGDAVAFSHKKMSKTAFLRTFYNYIVALLFNLKVLRFRDLSEDEVAAFLSTKKREAVAKKKAEAVAVAEANNEAAAKEGEAREAAAKAKEEEAKKRAKARADEDAKREAVAKEYAAKAEEVAANADAKAAEAAEAAKEYAAKHEEAVRAAEAVAAAPKAKKTTKRAKATKKATK